MSPSAPDDDSAPPTDKPRLRVLTCGSVDDGKSTLIGRLLYDCEQIPEDVFEVARLQSPIGSTGPGGIDFAFLLDGLESEREQGITIDVSYRSFTTKGRACQIADCPGHEQYTRNMVTAASNCDAAIVLIDSRHGVQTQTRRHLRICSMMGLRHVFVAINKMDLVGWSKGRFDEIKHEVRQLIATLKFKEVVFVPISAKNGENVSKKSRNCTWYSGETLLDWLNCLLIDVNEFKDLRILIQNVVRPADDQRAYLGTVLSGELALNQGIEVGQSKRPAKVVQLFNAGLPVTHVCQGDAIALGLDCKIDLSRGDVITTKNGLAKYSSEFVADVVWFSNSPLTLNRQFWFKGIEGYTLGRASKIRGIVSLETGEEMAVALVQTNEIGTCNIVTSKAVLCDLYNDSRECGGFLIVDTVSNETLGVGLVKSASLGATNVTPTMPAINSEARLSRLGQKPLVLWFTGLSASGKSTIAQLVERKLWGSGKTTFCLDGDNLRSGLCQDLGFTEAERVENVRRTAHVAKLMADAGMVVICALISPFNRDRAMAKEIIGSDRFIEIFIDTSIEECLRRDPKGLYERALRGEILDFTGVSAPYERPENAGITVDTTSHTAEQAADFIYDIVSTETPSAAEKS